MRRIVKLRTSREERGLALVSVLWALSILSLIAASMMTASVLSYRMERNDWSRVRAEALAESAINRAILGIADARPEMRVRVDGVAQDLAFGNLHVRVNVQDEDGKIDLNTAGNDILKGLFVSAGVPFAEADALTDRIVEWRTPSTDTRHLSVSDARNDAIAAPGYQPRNGPFQSVDELRLVGGMTPQLFARIEPALTVYSKKVTPNEEVAPREVLMALPGMDARKADDMLAQRINPAGSLTVNDTRTGTLDLGAPPNGRVFSIHAEVLGAKRHTTQDMVIELTGDPARPFLVLAWK